MAQSRFCFYTMSKNNTIRKSDKKFIRLEKARIRDRFSDLVKQEEAITELYKRFLPKVAKEEVKPAAAKGSSVAKETPKKEAEPKAKAEKKPAKKVAKAK